MKIYLAPGCFGSLPGEWVRAQPQRTSGHPHPALVARCHPSALLPPSSIPGEQCCSHPAPTASLLVHEGLGLPTAIHSSLGVVESFAVWMAEPKVATYNHALKD